MKPAQHAHHRPTHPDFFPEKRQENSEMQTPAHTVNQLVEAINRADLEGAVALYEKDAVLVAQPGQVARGDAELKKALAGFISMRATLRSDAYQVIEAGDIALYISRWRLDGTSPDGQAVSMAGESSDVLRRQRDGRWLIALDNPWGADLLPK
jgi:uncharacterized protein (TIGR02246 family)